MSDPADQAREADIQELITDVADGETPEIRNVAWDEIARRDAQWRVVLKERDEAIKSRDNFRGRVTDIHRSLRVGAERAELAFRDRDRYKADLLRAEEALRENAERAKASLALAERIESRFTDDIEATTLVAHLRCLVQDLAALSPEGQK